MNSSQKIRARVILVLIALAACVLGSALYWIQVVSGSSYVARANKQYIKPSATLFDRGSIFFESKDGTRAAAATVGSGYVVYMNPVLLSNPAQAYQAVSQYLTFDRADFMTRAVRPHDSYEELAHKVPEDTAVSIQ